VKLSDERDRVVLYSLPYISFKLDLVWNVACFLLLGALGLLGAPILLSQAQPTSRAEFGSLAARANAARDANRLGEAATLYRKALALRPGWAEGWWSLGTVSYDQNSYAVAARAFQKVTHLAPKNGTAYVMLGLSEFELGRDTLALRHIEQGMNLGFDKDSNLRQVALYHEGVLLQRRGRFQAAQETLEQLCLMGVRSDSVVNALGMVLLRMRSKNPPLPSSTDAEVVARVGGAGCLAGQKKYDEGRAGLTDLVSHYPKYPGIHYAFGMFLLEASDLAAAAAEFQEEIKNNPRDFVAHLQVAAAMYKTDSLVGVPFAEEAVRLVPKQPFGHLLLGLLLLDADDYLRAIPELEIAQKAFPREAKLYFALGTAYSRAGRKQDAARARATFTRLTEKVEKSNPDESHSEPGNTERERISVGDLPSSPQ
jgi:tetratricopeptide (TPR) repeat protein